MQDGDKVSSSTEGDYAAAGQFADRGIIPYPQNPYYWRYQGRSQLLIGGSVEDNMFQVPDLDHQLQLLVAAGGNYLRNTMSSRDEGNVWPFAVAQTVEEEGRRRPVYDLDRWNEEYWKRFENFLKLTAAGGVVVQVEIWATFDYYREPWAQNPFNPKNNLNYTAAETGLPERVDTHPTRTENSFFWSVPKENNEQLVLKYQRKFVDKLLSYSLAYDHVLYCMDNETSVTPNWGAYWSNYIKAKAKEAGKYVCTTEMWDKWDLSHPQHDATFDHPEIYDFIDISQNNHNDGEIHYSNALTIRRRIAVAKRPMNNVKIYGGTGRFGSAADGVERFWRNIFAGAASVRFHRPPSGIGISELAQRMIRSAREVMDAFDFQACRPAPDLITADSDEAYLLATAPDAPRPQCAVYLPRKGRVTLRAMSPCSRAEVRWYAIDDTAWAGEEQVDFAGEVSLQTPGGGRWAAVIRGV